MKPPRTLLEVFESLPEGTLAQFIQNKIVMSPSLNDNHQKVLDTIYRRIGNFIEQNGLGETRCAPYDVFLNKYNIFQPDIIFISNANIQFIKENGFHGAPDLIIEILSPSTAKYDLVDKKDVYEQFAVKEYIIINPADKTVTIYELNNAEFQVSFTSAAMVESKLLGTTFQF